MKNIKILLTLILGISFFSPVMAATSFRIDYSNLIQPSNKLMVELAPVAIKGDFETVKGDFSKIDPGTTSQTDRRVLTVLNDRQELLENTYQPVLSERAINETLMNYKEYRENQIRNEIQNVALQNDEIGVLDKEVDEYAIDLRLEMANYIQMELASWEREYTYLKEDMNDFVSYQKTAMTVRSGEAAAPVVTDSRAISLIVENKEDYGDKVDAIGEKQTSLVSRLSASVETEDNSLIADKNSQLLTSLESDQIDLNAKLADLANEKETIAALDAEIKLMEVALRSDDSAELVDNQYATMSTSDLIILRETSSAELERTLVLYESTQNDVQDSLTTSITNLRTLELKQ